MKSLKIPTRKIHFIIEKREKQEMRDGPTRLHPYEIQYN